MLKVLGKASSINVRKVLWICDEIGVNFEREDWGSGYRDTRTSEFLALNPNALVPVIVEDDDFVLWESNTIIRYLAASHGATNLLPETPRQRAGVESWMDWQATDLNSSWRYAFQALVRRNPEFANPADIAASANAWAANMAILDRQFQKTGAFVVGENFTLADIPIGLSVNRWFMTPMERPRLRSVEAYYERLSLRPAYLTHGRNGTP